MHIWTINDELPPIRLLRPVGSVDDATLGHFLKAARALETDELGAPLRFLHVFDCRRFEGLSAGQRRGCEDWLHANLGLIQRKSVAVALVARPAVVRESALLVRLLDEGGVATRSFDALEEALHWSLDQVFDCDEQIDPRLCIEGVAAFRETL